MIEVNFLTIAFICLGLSFLFSEIALKLRYPRVIGQIIAGILLSLPIFSALLTYENRVTIAFLGELGMVFLLLLTGLSLNRKKVYSVRKDSMVLAAGSVILPFVLGTGVIKAIGYSWVEAIIVGACLSLTAEGTTLEVLYDLKTLNTRIGSIIMSTGILDDLFEFLFLTILITAIYDPSLVTFLPVKILAFVVIFYLLLKISPLIFKILSNDTVPLTSFSYIIIVGLFISVIAHQFHLSVLLGAVLAGVLINYTEPDNAKLRRHVKELEVVSFSILVPFFFINIGLFFDFSALISAWFVVLLIILIAFISKIGGVLLVKPLTSLSWKQAHLVGWALNSRGMVELIIANFAFISGLIPVEIFTALVAMAILTTISFPFAVEYIAKDRRIWYD